MLTRQRNSGGAILAAACITLLAANVPAATPVHVPGPFVEHISPPALCRGRTNRIELFGRDLEGAVDVWTSTPGAQLTAKACGENDSQRAVFDIDVPADAPLGLYGLRLATRSGLSNVHLFLIDELPIQTRENPSPMKASLPAAIHGLCRAATVDRYEIDVRSGQRITFEVVGNRFGKDYDPLVTIRDARGRIVAERDNDVGLLFDCRFEHTFTDAGVYYVDVRDARFSGDPTWHYVLRMGDFPVARVSVPASVTPGEISRFRLPQVPGTVIEAALPAETASGWFFHEVRLAPQGPATWIALHADQLEKQIELEPNNDRNTATAAKLPGTLHGVLDKVGDEDWFSFEMQKGQGITVHSAARAFGSPADLELVLVNSNGQEVRRVDDVTLAAGTDSWSVDARFEFSSQHDGPHTLCVRDLTGDGGPAFAYRVEVTGSEPQLELRTEAARVTLPRENYQPIPLQVTRKRFAGPVELELLGAPAGVVLEPATIPADVSEIVCRLTADGSAPEGLATVQIVGRWKSDDPQNDSTATALAATFPLIDQRIKDKDLRVSALREDQRRLPPSLTNRLALLITPPAPFDVQLPEATLLITKYVEGEFPIVTTRAPDFDAPIAFTASGGQIGDEAEERSNVFLRFPTATPDNLHVAARVFNRILTNYGKFRVDVSATASEEARRITLNRTFELDLKPAFSPAPEPTALEVEPGGTATCRLLAHRTPAFGGAVTLTATALSGFIHFEEIEIPAGQPHIDIEVKAAADTPPGNYQLRLMTRGVVGKYEEEVNGPIVPITIKKPPAEKKP